MTIFPTWFAVQLLNLFHKRKRGSAETPTPPSLRGQCSAVRWCGFIWEASRGRKMAFCGYCHTPDRCWSKLYFFTAGQSDHEKVDTSAFGVGCTHQLCWKPLGALPSPPRRSVLLMPFLTSVSGRSARKRHLFSFGAFLGLQLWWNTSQRSFYLGFQSSGPACHSWKPSSTLYPEIKQRDKILCRWDTIPIPFPPVVLPGPAQNYNNFIYSNLTGIKSSLCWLSFLMEKTD